MPFFQKPVKPNSFYLKINIKIEKYYKWRYLWFYDLSKHDSIWERNWYERCLNTINLLLKHYSKINKKDNHLLPDGSIFFYEASDESLKVKV